MEKHVIHISVYQFIVKQLASEHDENSNSFEENYQSYKELWGGCPKVCVTWFVKGGNSTILPILLSSRKYGEIKTLHVGHE